MESILVVDDDADIRRLLLDLLSLNALGAEETPSGLAALDALASTPADEQPKLVLLDVQMPDLDGWDTLRALRARIELAPIAVVLCTVKASIADIDFGWSLGCDGYVGKPFAIDDLIAEVKAVLGRTPDERVARRDDARRALAVDNPPAR